MDPYFWLREKENPAVRSYLEAENAYNIFKSLNSTGVPLGPSDLIRNFVIFDGGQKKVPRLHQYEGVKAAQERLKRQEGGVIWHTQGSGKSILMVLLAKWLLEHDPNARILVITDRDELDKQIEGVFTEAGETISRTTSGRDLMNQLGQARPRLLCSLVHKFGKKGVDDFEQFIKELESAHKEGERAWQFWRWPVAVRWSRLFSIVR